MTGQTKSPECGSGQQENETASINYTSDGSAKPPIRFSFGKSKCDNQPEQMELPETEFMDFVRQRRGTQKGGDYICGPMKLGPHNDPRKYPWDARYRLKSHALPCRFFSLDFDAIPVELFEPLICELEKFNGCAWTTASHTDEAPRLRAILIADREMSRDERIRASEALERQLVELVSQGDSK